MISTTVAGRRSRSRARRVAVLVARNILLILVCLALATLVTSEGYLGDARKLLIINRAVGDRGFRLGAWEVQALSQKTRDLVARPGLDLSPQAQHDAVVAYFDAIAEVETLNARIERIYAGAAVLPNEDLTEPNAASQETTPHPGAASTEAGPLLARLEELRSEQDRRRPAVEAILQQQTASVLADEGLTVLGGVWPPVRFQFTESPYYLIISPRDRIVVEQGVYLEPPVAPDQMALLEATVEKQLSISALVEGTGGFSSYPTMIIDFPSLSWVLDTISHEWTHTYLIFFPLGWHYFDNGDTRTLNETTASIVGGEVGQLVLERFYPERVPPPQPHPPAPSPTPAPAAFEFGPFMRETRLTVDGMLSAGRVVDAEAYMEARRQILVSEGYAIRKLNQAYFAFHGSYAVGPAATDPIGDKLRALRQRAGSLSQFVHIVSRITSVSELDALGAAH